MTMFALSVTIIGAILGIRFTMLALVPTLICALTIGLGSLIVEGRLFPTTIELAALLTFLQIGYVCGAALRSSIAMPAADRAETRQVP